MLPPVLGSKKGARQWRNYFGEDFVCMIKWRVLRNVAAEREREKTAGSGPLVTAQWQVKTLMSTHRTTWCHNTQDCELTITRSDKLNIYELLGLEKDGEYINIRLRPWNQLCGWYIFWRLVMYYFWNNNSRVQILFIAFTKYCAWLIRNFRGQPKLR
jgi:hypothetical protein